MSDMVHQGTDLWLRKWNLRLGSGTWGAAQSITSGGTQAEAGNDFRMTFQIQAYDEFTPGAMIATIYNLSFDTAKSLVKEYDKISLEAGYINGRYGEIFAGTVKQYAYGHEQNMTESCLRIFAWDGDIAHTYAFSDHSLGGGTSIQERIDQIKKDVQAADPTVSDGYACQASGGVLPRGAVLWGLAVDEMRTEASRADRVWNIVDGKMQLVQKQGYIPGQVIPVNSATGMIGYPEVTDNGISVTTLLNPSFRVREQIHLDNDSINWVGAPGGGNITNWPGLQQQQLFAMLSSSGVYTILVRTHEGDTRGNPWYTHLICLAAGSAPPGGCDSTGGAS